MTTTRNREQLSLWLEGIKGKSKAKDDLFPAAQGDDPIDLKPRSFL